MSDDEDGEDYQENWSNDEMSDSEAPEEDSRTRARKSSRGPIRPAMSRVSAQVSGCVERSRWLLGVTLES